MSSFDQALTLVHDALAARRASGNEAERASLASLQRLVEATAGSKKGTASTTLQPPAPAPSVPKPVQQPAPAPIAAAAPTGEKLSFAERVRAAMAANAPASTPTPPAPSPVPEPKAAEESEPPIGLRRQKPLNLRDRLQQLNTRVAETSGGPVVLGNGGLHALLMIVGYATGDAEIAGNTPVAGEAGVLLGKITGAMNLTSEELYITNLYKSTAPTSREEALAMLTEEIQIIRPKCIVTLGPEALEALVGEAAAIEEERGLWHAYKGTPLMPTFHPTYLLSHPATSEKRKLWEDMLQVLELLAKPITPRQRGFFAQKG